MNKQPSRFVLALFVGMVLVATGLIATIPALFGPSEPLRDWVTAVLIGLFVALAAATLFRRPHQTEPDPDE